MTVTACAASTPGKVRNNNEDNLNLNGWIPDDSQLKYGFFKVKTSDDDFSFCICDGMGGESFGEIASRIAVETFSSFLPLRNEKQLNEFINEANNKICDLMRNRKSSIGSTFAGVTIMKNSVFIANVGDTKVYRIRDGAITKLNRDHTYLQMLIENNIITDSKAKKMTTQNSLLQYLGVFKEEMILNPYFVFDDSNNNDIYIACSDGLTDMISADVILNTSEQISRINEFTEKLIELALDAGGKDNISVIVAKIDK